LVSVFGHDGTFVRDFARGAPLNAPWAIIEGADDFGDYTDHILIGNRGDGRILAFDCGGKCNFDQALRNSLSTTVQENLLYGLAFLPCKRSRIRNAVATVVTGTGTSTVTSTATTVAPLYPCDPCHRPRRPKEIQRSGCLFFVSVPSPLALAVIPPTTSIGRGLFGSIAPSLIE
jgi:hypothetical protein